MARLFLASFLLVVIAVNAYHSISPLEVYWHAVLPNTTMPDPISYLIDPGWNITFLSQRRINVRKGLNKHILFGPLLDEYFILSTFFPKSSLNPGTQMNEGTNFTRNMWGNVFVPRPEADAIPFSTKNFSQLLDHFSMVPNSKEAKDLKKFVVDCEDLTLVGDTKFCPTSLESMIDNVVSLLGSRNIRAFTTIIHGNRGMTQREKVVYKTTTTIKNFSEHTKLVICHPSPSVQAVHYCHTNTAYKGYIVPLIGNDGSMVDALTICHHDSMNINRDFFKVLKIEPGSQPICHFLPENHILWVRNDEMPTLETVKIFGSQVHN